MNKLLARKQAMNDSKKKTTLVFTLLLFLFLSLISFTILYGAAKCYASETNSVETSDLNQTTSEGNSVNTDVISASETASISTGSSLAESTGIEDAVTLPDQSVSEQSQTTYTQNTTQDANVPNSALSNTTSNDSPSTNEITVPAGSESIWQGTSAAAQEQARTPSISTDKSDYHPEEVVTITGVGFDPSTALTIKVTRPDGSVVRGDGSFAPGSDTVNTNDEGSFVYLYQLDGITGAYCVDVIDHENTLLAQTTFTDSASYLVISPDDATAISGQTVTYTAIAHLLTESGDWYVVDVTPFTNFTTSDPWGSFSGRTYTAGKVGTWTQTGTYGPLKGTATVNVLPAAASTLTIAPDSTNLDPGATAIYTATASDGLGNTWDVTSSTIFNTSDIWGSFSGNVYTAGRSGTWTQTGTYNGLTDNATVIVNNLAPSVNAGSDQTVDEGDLVNFFGSFTDPGSDTHTIEWNFGDGSATVAGTLTPTHIYVDNGIYTVTLTVTDDDLGVGSDTLTVTVLNVAPTATATNNGPKDEGVSVTITASHSDPGILDTFVYSFDFDNDGTYEIVDQASSSATHTFNDDGTYTVGVRVKDKDGGIGEATTEVVINDLIPTAHLSGDTLLNEGDSGNYDASGSTSSPDTIILYQWDWNYNGAVFVLSGDTGATNSHSWSDNGTYTVAVRVTDEDGSTDIATLEVTVVNVAPTVEAGSNQTSNEGSLVNFTGSFTDSGSLDTQTILWNFGDGSAVVTGTLTPSHTYLDNGIYTVTLTVTDDDLGAGSDTLTVTVLNVAPVVNAGLDQIVNEGDTVNFSGFFTDPGSDTWTYLWNFGDGSATVVGTLTQTHIYVDNGIYTVTLTVTDDDLGVGSDTLTVTVNNVAPTASATNTGPVDEGSPVTVNVSATDPGSLDTFTYSFDFNNDSIYEIVDQASSSASYIFNANGTYSVKVRVKDKDGGEGTATTEVVINDLIPVANLVGDTTLNEGTSGSYDASSSTSSLDAIVSYEWDWNYNGVTFIPSGDTGATATHAWGDNGIYTVVVRVTDSDGSEDIAILEVAVLNVNPAVDAGLDQTSNEGDTVNFSGSFTDPGSLDTQTILWNFGDGSATVAGTLTPSHTYLDNGIYTVTLTVTDDDGGVGVDTLTVTVLNVAPTASATNNGPKDEGSPVTITASQTDPGALDTFVYSFDWDNNGVYEIEDQASPSASYIFNANGTYPIKVRVKDDDGGIGTATTEVVINDLGPSANLSGDTPLNEGTSGSYDASGSTSLPDTIVLYQWDWNYDGVTFIPSGDSGATATHAWGDNGVYQVAVRVTDSDGSEDIAILEVTVLNVNPAVDAGLDQTSNEGDTVNFSGSFTDPGSDTHTILWNFGDSSAVVTGILNPTHIYLDNGVYVVTLTVTDDDLGVGSDTLTVTVNNVAPTATATNTGPVDEGSPVTINVTATDPGSLDTFTYSFDFSNDGIYEIVDQASSSATHTFNANGTYTVKVRVKDKDGEEATATTDVTVNGVITEVIGEQTGQPSTGTTEIASGGEVPTATPASDQAQMTPATQAVEEPKKISAPARTTEEEQELPYTGFSFLLLAALAALLIGAGWTICREKPRDIR